MRKKLLFILLAALSCNLAWAQNPAYIPATGLTSFSNFDGSHVFTGYNYSDLFTTDRNGVANNAIQFNGQGNIYSTNYLPVSKDSITVATWFKFDGYSTFFTSGLYTPSIVDYRFDPFCTAHGCQPINLRVVFGGISTYIEASVNVFDPVSGQNTFYTAGDVNTSFISRNTWNHVAMTWDTRTDELILYINGVATNTVPTPGGAYLNDVQPTGTRIGATSGIDYQTCFNGALDELGFWSRALTPAEIQNIYVQSAPSSTGCDAPEILTQSWQNDTLNICAHCDDFAASCNTTLSAATLSLPNTTYAWYNANGMVSGSAALNIRYWSGLPAGPYWIVGMNACDTITSDTVYLNYYTSFSSSIDEVGNVLTAVTNSTNNTYTYTYEWYDGNLNLVGTGNTYTATASGTYYVKVFNQFGCSSLSSTTITLGGCTVPTFTNLVGTGDFAGIAITDTITLCPGYGLELQANFTGSPTSYAWFYDGLQMQALTTQNLFLSNVGVGRYWATATNSCGTVSSDTILVQFTPDYTFVSSQQGNTVQVTIDPTPVNANVLVSWSFDDRFLTLAGTGTPFSPSSSATYYPAVEITYNANYTFNTCYFYPSPVSFTAISCPNPPVVYPLAIDKCDGDSYNFDGQELMTTGTYFATFVDANGCDSIVELTLTMFDAPATPTIVANGDTLSVETTDTVALTYAWYLDGSLLNGETNPSLIATADGDYTVWVTLGNCVEVSAPFNYTGVGVGITENAFANAVSIYPNPTQGVLNIEYSGHATLRYHIYNVTGTVIATGMANSNTQLDLTNQAAGVYLLHLADTNGNVTTKRFVKE